MSDPFDLPVELLDPILDLASGTDLEVDGDHSERLDRRLLRSLLLVNRKWYHGLLPRVYSSWYYNGACHSYMSLWRFLRTVLTSPHIAVLVKTLNVGNWGHGTPFYLSHEVQEPSPADRDLLSEAICRIGVAHLEDDILEKFSVPTPTDHRPLMALLLACLPNLSTLHAHVPKSDPYLQAIMLESLKRPVLANLRELHVFPEVPIFDQELNGSPGYEWQTRTFDRLELDITWPLLFLHSLHTVFIHDLDTRDLALLLKDHRAASNCICHVRHLHVATHTLSECLPDDVCALLTLPKSLKTVSFAWKSYKFKHGVAKNDITWKISNEQVWAALQQHAPTLESVDIEHGRGSGARHRMWRDHFGSLASFTRLKKLVIPLEVLVGLDHSLLSTSLPASLEIVMLPTDSLRIDRLSPVLGELSSVIASALPRLKQLWLNDQRLYDPDGSVTEPYQRLRMACTQRGIQLLGYQTEDPSPFRRAAVCTRLRHPDILLREDGYQRLALEHEHQPELKDGSYDDDYFAHIWPHRFYDHRGIPAFMLYEDMRSERYLYPLISFAVYFTHPAAAGNHTQNNKLLALFVLIRREMTNFHFRLDIYFLPRASEEDCMAHYRAQKAISKNSRVTCDLTERVLRNRLTEPPPPSSFPSGGWISMVDEFTRDGRAWGGALCICIERDWAANGEKLCCLLFDSAGDSGAGNDDDDDDDAALLPRCWKEWLPISGSSPGVEERGETDTAAAWMYDLALPLRDGFSKVRQEARNRGWNRWC
ncbi:hypothetical protein BJY01DRAFT_201378 [Aspergillus pseudoustus]|uniref:F-box domain-containing protein n=1 Tax=Aspergillus pseudoustus TaxID=1810923 RepID=A0ABR4L2E7_9EURO